MGNNTFYAPNDYRNYLEHHGIRGMKWGVRRFQNKDGSYTSAGKSRYGVGSKEAISAYRSSYDKASSMGDKADEKWRETQAARKQIGRTAIGRTIASARNKTEAAKKYNKLYDEWSNMQDAADEQWRDSDAKYKMTGRNRLERVANNIKYDMKPLTPEQKAARNAKIKKVALAVAGTAAVAAGTYAAHKYYKSTMTEAMSMMNDARKRAVDSYLDKIGEAYDHQRFTSKMVDSFERGGLLNTPPGQTWLAADQANRKAVSDIIGKHREYEKRSASNIANRLYQHKAQREVVARDISNLKDNALGRLRGSDKGSINARRDNNQKTAERYIERIVNRGDAGRYLRKKSKL